MDAPIWLIVVGAAWVGCAGFVQGLSGFGFSLTALSFWAWALDTQARVAAGGVRLPALVSKVAPSHGLRLGQSVFHNKFGEGVVLTLKAAAAMRARRSTSAATVPSGWRWRLPS